MNPIALIVQPKPAEGSSDLTSSGKMTPPVTLPEAPMPMARDRLVLQYVATIARAGQKSSPLPRPTHTPWARKICQYRVQAEAAMVPTATRTMPEAKTG
jgi:hypothetical protein